ncbi:hypothetical protein [Enterococcus faecium]|uniref:hypothetical protein n=1 Tax=Enterococcus faecium TaxID=1352 RepID=UPI0023B32C99|nr:hypothetical protein [Enterococcus faecium]
MKQKIIKTIVHQDMLQVPLVVAGGVEVRMATVIFLNTNTIQKRAMPHARTETERLIVVVGKRHINGVTQVLAGLFLVEIKHIITFVN